MKKLLKKVSNRKGFTLIELIIVIAILGILATLAVPRLAGFTDRARDAANEQVLAIVRRSVETLVATGDIIGSGAITVANNAANDELVYDGADTITSHTDAQLTADINELVGTGTRNVFQAVRGAIPGATITIAADGTVDGVLN